MIRLSVTVGPYARIVRQGLENLRAEIPKISRFEIYETMQGIARRMKVYPPPPAKSRYRRTYRLREGWSIEKLDKGYQIRNSTPYAKHVVGNAYGQGQAYMHVGRWQVMRDVVESEMSTLPGRVQNNLVMVARRSFGAA